MNFERIEIWRPGEIKRARERERLHNPTKRVYNVLEFSFYRFEYYFLLQV